LNHENTADAPASPRVLSPTVAARVARITPAERLHIGQVAEKARAGYTRAATAEALGLRPSYVSTCAWMARQLGIEFPAFPRELPRQIDRLKLVARSREVDRRELAAEFGTIYSTACRILAEMEEAGARVGKRKMPPPLDLPPGMIGAYRYLRRRHGKSREEAEAICRERAAAATPAPEVPEPPAAPARVARYIPGQSSW
jgi:hypothetical protein